MQTLTVPTTPINTLPIARGDYTYYSVSRLQTYLKCGEAYRLQYVERQKREYTYSYSTVVGSLVHNALEKYFLQGGAGINLLGIFENTSEAALIDLNLLGDSDGTIYLDLLRYARGVGSLYERASATYTGKDAIRTAKGEVPSIPQATSSWKDAMVGLGQGLLKDGLDALSVGRGLPFSLCDAYAEAYALTRNYKVPVLLAHHVELGLSQYEGAYTATSQQEGSEMLRDHTTQGRMVNPVPLPPEYGGDQGIYLMGSIDLVATYEGRLCIIDHKTSSGPAPTLEEVSTNPQLLAYAWAYEQLTGKVVEGVGINHIRSGKLVVAPPSIHKDKVLHSLLGVHKAIEAGYFPLHTPSEYDSPCQKWYGKECPFKVQCWGCDS